MKIKKYSPYHPMLAIGLSLAVAGLVGCNQQPTSNTPTDAALPSGEAGIKDTEPGRKLEGAELDAFLEMRSKLQKTSPGVNAAESGAPLPKTAATSCIVNFNSYAGLDNMADKAYTGFAVAPWYHQPCANSYKTYVIPINYSFYLLPTEASGTCPGAYGKIGTGSILNCQNQSSGANWPRRGSNGSTTYGDLGLWFYMYQGNTSKNFNFNSIKVVSGTVTIYGHLSNGSWWYWSPLTAGTWNIANGTNLSEIQVFSLNNAGVYYVDDVNLTGL